VAACLLLVLQNRVYSFQISSNPSLSPARLLKSSVHTSKLQLKSPISSPSATSLFSTLSDGSNDALSVWKGAKVISAKDKDMKPIMSSEDIAKILPHRYPFLLVDRVVEFEPGKRAVGLKSISMNEPQFTGHFPGRPIMPGVLMVEAMAQLGSGGSFDSFFLL
jgi:hypothetical protein